MADRIRLVVEINLDPVEGPFHTMDQHKESLQYQLQYLYPWYYPVVASVEACDDFTPYVAYGDTCPDRSNRCSWLVGYNVRVRQSYCPHHLALSKTDAKGN